MDPAGVDRESPPGSRTRRRWKSWPLAVPLALVALVTAMNVTAWQSYVAACEAYRRWPSWDFLTRPFSRSGILVDPDTDELMEWAHVSGNVFGSLENTRLWLDPLDPLARDVELDAQPGCPPLIRMRLALTGSGWRASGMYCSGLAGVGISKEKLDGKSFYPSRWVPAWKF
jgi:hypothetical protein